MVKKVRELVSELNSQGVALALSNLPAALKNSLRSELFATRDILNSDREAAATAEEIEKVKRTMDSVSDRIDANM